MEEETIRYFKGIDTEIGGFCGRYYGTSAKQGAAKYFTTIKKTYREKNMELPNLLDVYVYESTRHSEHKIYGFMCETIILDDYKDVIIIDRTTVERKMAPIKTSFKINEINVPENIYELVMAKIDKRFKSTKSAKKID